MNDWNLHKIGANIMCFDNRKQDISVFLEYDYTYEGFRELSDILMCKSYHYKGKNYSRDLITNKQRYYKILSTIPVKVWEKAYTMF